MQQNWVKFYQLAYLVQWRYLSEAALINVTTKCLGNDSYQSTSSYRAKKLQV